MRETASPLAPLDDPDIKTYFVLYEKKVVAAHE